VFDKTQTNVPAVELAIKDSSTIRPALSALDSDFSCIDKTDQAFAGWISDLIKFPSVVFIAVDKTNKGEFIKSIDMPSNGEPGIITEINRLRTVGKGAK
jgi:hypothetical protein